MVCFTRFPPVQCMYHPAKQGCGVWAQTHFGCDFDHMRSHIVAKRLCLRRRLRDRVIISSWRDRLTGWKPYYLGHYYMQKAVVPVCVSTAAIDLITVCQDACFCSCFFGRHIPPKYISYCIHIATYLRNNVVRTYFAGMEQQCR